MTMIELKDITFAYDKNKVLDDISISFQDGKCYVIEGPNGCGKSTLFRILNGLTFPDSGSYLFDGNEVTEKKLRDKKISSDFHKQIGYVFQNSETQLFTRSVEDEIAFGLYQLGYDDKEVKNRTEKYMDLLQITTLRERAPFSLSGGEKKRCALAAVLAMEPKVLIMDEPISGLDEDGQNWIISFIQELKKEDRLIIIATHDKQLSDAVSDEIIHMDKYHHIVS